MSDDYQLTDEKSSSEIANGGLLKLKEKQKPFDVSKPDMLWLIKCSWFQKVTKFHIKSKRRLLLKEVFQNLKHEVEQTKNKKKQTLCKI